tara:strand:+ start:321 stop:563 length:243 start_codon:yes stop_codon:yes gene_type:complete
MFATGGIHCCDIADCKLNKLDWWPYKPTSAWQTIGSDSEGINGINATRIINLQKAFEPETLNIPPSPFDDQSNHVTAKML